jgi:hypothetical protein
MGLLSRTGARKERPQTAQSGARHLAADTLLEVADVGSHTEANEAPLPSPGGAQRRSDSTSSTVIPAVPVASDRVLKPTNRLQMWIGTLGLAAATFALYGRTIGTNFVGDDWLFLATAREHSLSALLPAGGGYHYDPLMNVIIFAMYHAFGLHPVPYHVLAYICFWLGSVLVMRLGWKITDNLGLGIIAGFLFVAFGTQYEAAVWGVVAYAPAVSTILYLAGLLSFIAAHNTELSRARRAGAYVGFLLALVLGPFVYEQDISLLGACVLYRLLVLDANEAFSFRALPGRLRAWLADFALPGIFFLSYVGLKVWLGRQTTTPQLPGLTAGWEGLTFTAALGFLQAFVPGITVSELLRASLDWIAPKLHLLTLLGELLVLGLLFVKVKPVYRFLLAVTATLVVTQTLALANISSRHLFLITAPSAILWAGLLVYVRRWVQAWMAMHAHAADGAGWLSYVPSAALALLFVFAGVRYSFREQAYWRSAVGHVDSLMAQVARFSAADTAATTLYLVDVPDYYAAPTGESMYEFRNSPQALVELTMPNRFSSVVAVRTDDSFPINWGYTVLADEKTLLQWSQQPGALMLQYDAASGNFRPWTPPALRASVEYFNPQLSDH